METEPHCARTQNSASQMVYEPRGGVVGDPGGGEEMGAEQGRGGWGWGVPVLADRN